MPLAKVLAAFAVMLAGLRLRQPLWLSVLAGGLALALIFHMPLSRWALVAGASMFQRETIYLILILALILFLSEVLEKSGQTRRLMQAASGFLSDPRLRLAFFPALVGFLPMPGGAVFSAPLVRDMADDLGLARRDTALVNYWFRHLWELCWPLYPGIILTSSLAGVPLARLIVYTCPCIALCLLLGWRFIMRPAVAHLQAKAPSVDAPRDVRAALYEGLPMLVAICCGLGFEVAMTVLAPELPFELGIMAALVLAILCALVQNRVGPGFVAGVLADRELYRLVALVVSVLLFKDVLQASGAVRELAAVASGPGALFALTLGLPFLVGLISGITVAFVGATFPIILGVLQNIGAANGMEGQLLPHLTLGLFAGFTGVMISPLHVCFILSCQFFGADFASTWRRLVLPCCLLLACGIAWFFILTRLF
jgi:integral membrane protein (TIGR00529 family)